MADDIIPLRASYVQTMVRRITELEAEIERLRAAGDALVAAIRNHDLTQDHLRAWKEARREQ